MGRQVLQTFGFQFPDQKAITIAAEESQGVRKDVDQLKKDVADLKSAGDVTRANHAIINAKLDQMSNTFTGFQVDFAKWRKDAEKSSNP